MLAGVGRSSSKLVICLNLFEPSAGSVPFLIQKYPKCMALMLQDNYFVGDDFDRSYWYRHLRIAYLHGRRHCDLGRRCLCRHNKLIAREGTSTDLA